MARWSPGESLTDECQDWIGLVYECERERMEREKPETFKPSIITPPGNSAP